MAITAGGADKIPPFVQWLRICFDAIERQQAVAVGIKPESLARLDIIQFPEPPIGPDPADMRTCQ